MSEKDPWVSLVLSVISLHFSLKHSGIESIKSPPLLRWCIAIIWAVNNVILSLFHLFLLACSCNPAGTSGPVNECHPQTGNCQCLSHVTGRDCSYCEVGFFNLQPGVGCERYRDPLWSCGWCLWNRCNIWAHKLNLLLRYFPAFLRCKCNPIGSSSIACHPITGQCVCRAGVEGRLCDSCRAGFFGFSSRGCRGTGLYFRHRNSTVYHPLIL